MSERFKVIIAYTLICLIWGSTWLVIKLGTTTLTPWLGAGIRFAVSVVILFGIIKYRGIEIPWTPAAKKFYFNVSFFSFTVPFALVYWGAQYIPSGLSSVLFGTYPFSVAIFSYLFLKEEKLTVSKIAGIVFGFSGVLVIFANDLRTNSEYALFGMAATVVSAMMQAYSVIIIKKHANDISPFVTLMMPMVFGMFFLLGGSLLFEHYETVHFTFPAIVGILYLSIFGTILTFVSYFWLLKKTAPVILSLTAFITPVIAVTLGVLLNHEQFSPEKYIGAAIVLAGILIANGEEIRDALVK